MARQVRSPVNGQSPHGCVDAVISECNSAEKPDRRSAHLTGRARPPMRSLPRRPNPMRKRGVLPRSCTSWPPTASDWSCALARSSAISRTSRGDQAPRGHCGHRINAAGATCRRSTVGCPRQGGWAGPEGGGESDPDNPPAEPGVSLYRSSVRSSRPNRPRMRRRRRSKLGSTWAARQISAGCGCCGLRSRAPMERFSMDFTRSSPCARTVVRRMRSSRLLVGPLANVEVAARLCASVSSTRRYCQPVAFAGHRLAHRPAGRT